MVSAESLLLLLLRLLYAISALTLSLSALVQRAAEKQ